MLEPPPSPASPLLEQGEAVRSVRPGAWRARRLGLLALRSLVAAVVLVYLFRQVEIGTVLAGILAVRLELVLIAFAAALLTQVLMARRLWILLRAQGIELGWTQVIAINLGSSFYGLFLPGGNVAGQAVRFFRLSRAERKYAATMIAMLCDRLMATLALAVTGLAFWIIDRPLEGGRSAIVLGAGTAVLALLAVPLFHRRTAEFLASSKVMERQPGAGWAARAGRTCSEALKAYQRLPRRSLLGLLGLSVGGQLLGTVSYQVLAQAVEIDLPLTTVGWIRSAVVFLTMIPISISGLGLRESGLLVLLRPYGIDPEAAVAFSLLVFGVTLVAVGIAGGLLEAAGFFWRRRNDRG